MDRVFGTKRGTTIEEQRQTALFKMYKEMTESIAQ